MSDEEITQEKQWVTLRSGSMQAYVGHGNVANVAHELRCAVGKPHGLLLASVEETDEDLVESLRRDLLAEGFTVSLCGLPSGRGSCSIASVEGFWQELAEVGITSDDLVVAKVDPHRAPAYDAKIELVVELDALHLFDAATERRLTA